MTSSPIHGVAPPSPEAASAREGGTPWCNSRSGGRCPGLRCGVARRLGPQDMNRLSQVSAQDPGTSGGRCWSRVSCETGFTPEARITPCISVSTVPGLMCRHQISIDPRGRLYDCDFNQAIGLGTPGANGRLLWQYAASELANRTIATGDHCYGCTAGAGSSCGGALA